jgi:bifunctional UDP-N-acetylglucosamine pyrophosphorylase/glucosamine-1-phosphate N-acetyltransferase
MKFTHVILAAGFGTRMKSQLPKVLHPLLGRPMVEWAVQTSTAVTGVAPHLVVGHGREQVEAYLGARAHYVWQRELLGTGHAVMQAAPALENLGDATLVSYADMPLLQADTLRRLTETFAAAVASGKAPALAMLTVTRDDPQGFGRVVRGEDGAVRAIVEEVDCTPAQRMIRELNPGVYCYDTRWLLENLAKIPLSPKGEYYVTDLVEIAVAQGRVVLTLAADAEEVNGVNNRVQLAHAGRILQQRILEQHMLNGVTIVDPEHTYVEASVTIGADTTLWPGCLLQGDTSIGQGAVVGPNSQIVDSTIGDGCRVVYSMLEGARMDAGSEIGPFGHLRKGAHLGEGVHMGNFGEVKNSYLGPGTKMGHFSYIGDAQVGTGVTIGAGTITCNFDGEKKHPTVVGEGAFIGSDSLLVAPVELGQGARTGAGSVVTHDVPAHTLVYGVPARPAAPSTSKSV